MAKMSITINDQPPIIISVDEPHASHTSVHAGFGMYDDERQSMTLFTDGHISTPEASKHLMWTEQLSLTEADTVTITLVSDDMPTSEPSKVRVSQNRPLPINGEQADGLLVLFEDFSKRLSQFSEQYKSNMDAAEYDEFTRALRYYGWRMKEEIHRDVFKKIPEKREQLQLVKQFRRTGVATISAFTSPKGLQRLHQALADFPSNTRLIAQKAEDAMSFAHSRDVLQVVALLLSEQAQLVRSILFDKNQENNWLVPWHQDRTIAVSLDTEARKAQLPDWTGWTQKEGVTHVQPDKTVLDRTLTLRLHLDDTPEDNACLRVIHGSHAELLNHDAVLKHADAHEETAYPVAAGDLVIMHPLIIHASHKSTQPSHRRVLHLEFSDAVLPEGVEWAERV